MELIQKHFSQRIFHIIESCVLILILAFSFVIPVLAAGPSFSFSPATASVKVGDTFTIDILVSATGIPLDTARAEVSFPTDKLEATGFAIGALFPQQASFNVIDNQNGLLYEGGAILGGATTSDGTFGRITFKAKAQGSATLTFTNSSRLIQSGVEKIDLAGLGTATITIQPLQLLYQCQDGIDNDNDNKTDYPSDPGCTSSSDDNEADALPVYQCNDGIDNDSDGKTDFPNDPGCSSLADNDEANALPVYECNDGIDNDSDGKTDFPNDPGCSSVTDNSEADAVLIYQCNDGIDNDSDGKTDYPSDPGCSSTGDNDETNAVVRPEEPVVPQQTDKPVTGGTGTEPSEPEPDTEQPAQDEPAEPIEQTEQQAQQQITEDTEQIVQSEAVQSVSDAVAGAVSQVLKLDSAVISKDIQQTVRTVVKTTKEVQKVNNEVSAPTLSVVTATSVAAVATVGATSTTGLTLLIYAQFLISQLITFFTRRRKSNWGVIYNSITKQPVDLAVVRVYNADTNAIVATRVSDRQGRYQFIVNPGRYIIKVDKNEFKFPCVLLNQINTDGKFDNVYYGTPIEIKEKDVLALAIPVDPDKQMQENKKLLKLRSWQSWQKALTLLGPILGLISLALNPRWWVAGIVVLQIAMYFLFKRLSGRRKPGRFGIVKDVETKKSLAQSIVRVFDHQYNKLLETQITDRNGRYGFLVGNNKYYLTSDKVGYIPHRSPVYDLTGKETGYLAETIHLQPHKLGQAVDDAQKRGEKIDWRSNAGRNESVDASGVKKLSRPEDQKFSGAIKGVDLNEVHEDFYSVDTLGSGNPKYEIRNPNNEESSNTEIQNSNTTAKPTADYQLPITSVGSSEDFYQVGGITGASVGSVPVEIPVAEKEVSAVAQKPLEVESGPNKPDELDMFDSVEKKDGPNPPTNLPQI